MIALNLTDLGKKTVHLVPLDRKGRPTKIDTQDRMPAVTTLDGDCTAETPIVNEDGSIDVTIVSGVVDDGADFKVSTLELNCDADKDAGEDRALTETFVVTVTRAEATAFNATIGEEVDKEA